MKKTSAALLAFLLIFLVAFASHGQSFKYLQFRKGVKDKNVFRYYIGQSITYQQKGLDYFMTDVIVDLKPDLIVLRENIISPDQIEIVDIRSKDTRNYTLRNLTTVLGAAGLGYIALDMLNNDFDVDQNALIISGSLLGSAYIMSKLRYKYFRTDHPRARVNILIFGED